MIMGFGTLIGRKIGMTRIFDEMGNDFPVTVLKAGPCPVVQIKTYEKEYSNSIRSRRI